MPSLPRSGQSPEAHGPSLFKTCEAKPTPSVVDGGDAVPESLLRGISLTLLATLGIVLMNTCAKMSSLSYGPIEMVFYRGLVALLILVPYMMINRPSAVFKTRRIKAHLYRALIGNLGVGSEFLLLYNKWPKQQPTDTPNRRCWHPSGTAPLFGPLSSVGSFGKNSPLFRFSLDRPLSFLAMFLSD